MGVPTSEVGYASAMPRKEAQEVHIDMWGHWGEKHSAYQKDEDGSRWTNRNM